jgi:hypothetical protein
LSFEINSFPSKQSTTSMPIPTELSLSLMRHDLIGTPGEVGGGRRDFTPGNYSPGRGEIKKSPEIDVALTPSCDDLGSKCREREKERAETSHADR